MKHSTPFDLYTDPPDPYRTPRKRGAEVTDLAYSYIRWSSPQQGAGDSRRRQTSGLESWLAKTGVPLDSTLSLRDEGVSGYTGEHRSNPDLFGLALFLECVKSGRVKRGSYLVVEALDRLSREHVQKATLLCLNLLQSGIRIVQLSPVEMVYDDKSDMPAIMMMIMELSRGHSESAMKSVRLSAVWKKKKEMAGTKPIGKNCPRWVRLEGGRLVRDEERAVVVRRMFRMSAEGMGGKSIAKALNAEKVATWGVAKAWGQTGVYNILTSRAVIGEYQPHTGRKRPLRVAVGDPIKNYYPAVVSEEEFFSVQAGLHAREQTGSGRKSKHVNLFSGLMRDARDGGAIHCARGNKSLSHYVGANGKKGTGRYCCFPQEGFDRCILQALAEVKPDEVFGEEVTTMHELAGRLVVVDARLSKLKKLLLEEDEAETLVSAVRELTAQRASLLDGMERERLKTASRPAETFGLLQALLDGKDRARLANAIHRTVSELRCLFVGSRGQDRVAIVLMSFHNSTAVRTYWIDYIRGGRGGRWGKPTAEEWSVKSVRAEDYPDFGTMDIRTPEGAKKIEEIIKLMMRRR